jgi:signal transduction histidine kinase
MVDIVEKVCSLYENEEQIKLEFHPESRSIMVHVDRNLWIQVLVNLLQNAQQALVGIPNGEIHIQLTTENHFCLIQVSDNGCGISSEEAERIFTPHFTTKSSGSGIGLSLVKQIVEKHGGIISFESQENIGTTFRLALPTVD